MRSAFFTLAIAFGGVSSVMGQGTPRLISPTANSEIGLNQFVEYTRPGHLVSEDTRVQVTLSNATWSDSLTPFPTFSPGNGPQDIAKGNLSINATEWAEGAYNFTVTEISPFKGTIATITVPVTLNYDA
ncbi:hypothetical protein LXA43DRAFT_313713 [Ganoderma leucocontextum]|nr:hypothetical protein LXA43DRAFT_313713 [Ganoderma leucocontextum]